jgi:phenylacetate-CoA ligase
MMLLCCLAAKKSSLTFTICHKNIIEEDGNVKEFVIKQTTMDCFEIDY